MKNSNSSSNWKFKPTNPANRQL